MRTKAKRRWLNPHANTTSAVKWSMTYVGSREASFEFQVKDCDKAVTFYRDVGLRNEQSTKQTLHLIRTLQKALAEMESEVNKIIAHYEAKVDKKSRSK